ncbi:hypothetical protein V1226_03290 [Lachnospiraceae bacterium JLR.KK009]
MEKGQLLIAVPTKDHPQYIAYYLSEVMPDAKRYHVDVCIYDSSAGNATKDIVEEKVSQGYGNLSYRKMPEELQFWEKVKGIYVGSGYEYVWLCGDGIIVMLDKYIDVIVQEMEKKRDMIVFSSLLDGKEECIGMEITDPLVLMENCWGGLGIWGSSIVRGDLFQSGEWDRYEKDYRSFIHLGAYFEKFAAEELNAVYIHNSFLKLNPFKKASTWVTGKKVLEVMEDYTKIVEMLPERYSPVKWEYAKDVIATYLGLERLWVLRWDGNLDAALV